MGQFAQPRSHLPRQWKEQVHQAARELAADELTFAAKRSVEEVAQMMAAVWLNPPGPTPAHADDDVLAASVRKGLSAADVLPSKVLQSLLLGRSAIV